MATKAHLEGNKRYLAKLDEIRIRLPKGRKEEIQGYAAAAGESVNSYVTKAIEQRIEHDKSKEG